MDLNLTGRRVLVTGASRGIGAVTARAFAEEGCALHLAARDAEALDRLAEELAADCGTEVMTHSVDLSDPAGVDRLAGATRGVDILVNNAGDLPGGPLSAVEDKHWREGFALKVFGYIALARRVYEGMRGHGGVIVNNIGASGEHGDATYIAGSTGNAALIAFTRTLGGVSPRDNVRVVGVSPGPVDTERITRLMRGMAAARLGDADRYRELWASHPAGRPATPREIADSILFLASDRSAHTSGVVLTVDGGLTAASL